jgi:hypothetical protein
MTKGRTVPPPRDPALPPPHKMARIAEAVHRAIVAESGTDGLGLCTVYALAGAVAASKCLLTPDQQQQALYDINVGSCVWPCTQDGQACEMRADDPATRGQEFHAVMIRTHLDGRHEVADLSSRHYRAWAERSGLGWDLPAPPPYVWGWQTDVAARGIVFTADPELTTQVRQIYIESGREYRFLAAVVRHALRLLPP